MTAPKSTRRENRARLDAFFDLLDAARIDGAVLDRRDDQFYFSGYTGSDAVAVLSAKSRRGWLVTDSRYTEEAEKTAPDLEILRWRENFSTFTGRLAKRLRLHSIGYTPRSLTVAFHEGMKGAIGGVKKWQDADPVIARLRSVKSAGEITAIEAALACAENAFRTAKKRWRPGMTETDVKNDLEWEMRRGGAEDAAFETIVASAANTSLPHAHSGGGKIRPGKMLLIDFGARLGRYNSDLTRTLWAGSIPAVWRKRYLAVLEAQQAGIEAIRPGVSGGDVHARAAAVLSRAGMDDKFTHGLGHGVGLAVHEEPRLSPMYRKNLEPGNVVTVEPGVYFPGAGGIRVEDMALVTGNGVRILSSLSKDLDSAVF